MMLEARRVDRLVPALGCIVHAAAFAVQILEPNPARPTPFQSSSAFSGAR